jgi:hypothetical protein
MVADVALYLGRSELGPARVPGLALVYPHEPDARNAFLTATYSVLDGEHPPTEIGFKRSTLVDQGIFYFRARGKNEDLEIDVDAIPWPSVEAFGALLKRVRYFFVVFGFFDSNEQLQLVDPTDHALFKSYINIEGETVWGQDIDQVRWNNVLGEGAHIILGSDSDNLWLAQQPNWRVKHS